MKNTVLLSGLAVAIVMGATVQGVASADGHGKHRSHYSFEKLDTNGDGKITQEEMTAHIQSRFEATDVDGDGSLSRDELVDRITKRAAERAEKRADHILKKRDANGDGILSPDEMQKGYAEKKFAKADTDDDGAISKEEYKAAKAKYGKHGKHGGEAKDAAE